MKCEALIAAEIILADSISKRVSLINLMGDGAVELFPIAIPIMVYLEIEQTATTDSVSDLFLEIKYNDKSLAKRTINVEFSKQFPVAKTVIRLGTIPIDAIGTLSLNVIFKGNVIKQTKFNFYSPEKQAAIGT